MSETINVEARVDELSKPENKNELEKVLNNEFNQATNPAASKPADGQKPETTPTNPDNKPATDAGQKPTDDKGAPSNAGDDNAGEGANKGDRFKDLLADRNEAKSAAAQAQTENQILSKQVADLTALVQKLASGKDGEGEGNKSGDGTPSADDLKGKDIASIINEILDKREQSKSAATDAEKSITEAIQALESNPETPKAKEYEADIKALMAKHPTISAYMAYMALVGSGKIPSEGIASNANRTGTGNRSKSNLLKNKRPEDMTTAELEAHLKAEEKAGGLQGLV